MTTKTIKIVLFAALVAAIMSIPLMGSQEAEAAMAAPIMKIESGQGISVTWTGSVAHAAGQWVHGAQTNWCGQSFTANGFYDTASNKRGASHLVPSTINQTCNFDADTSGYFNVTLDKVEYSFQGDGNTSIVKHNMGSGIYGYKYFTDAVSNSGTEWVTIKATYIHTS